MKGINKIIYCFSLFVLAFFLATGVYAKDCSSIVSSSGGLINSDCTWNCTKLGGPSGTNYGAPTASGYTNCCDKSGGSWVLKGCKWNNKTETQWNGECRLGTRKYRTKTFESNGVIHCDASISGYLLGEAYKNNNPSWGAWQDGQSSCTKDCSGYENKTAYRIVNCTQQARKCCSKGYWTDWGKTGCNSSGYVSGS